MACRKRKMVHESYIDKWLEDLAKTSQAGKWTKEYCEKCKAWHIKRIV